MTTSTSSTPVLSPIRQRQMAEDARLYAEAVAERDAAWTAFHAEVAAR